MAGAKPSRRSVSTTRSSTARCRLSSRWRSTPSKPASASPHAPGVWCLRTPYGAPVAKRFSGRRSAGLADEHGADAEAGDEQAADAVQQIEAVLHLHSV